LVVVVCMVIVFHLVGGLEILRAAAVNARPNCKAC
jgi:hypothetical protein